jgi:hypothetical protein
MATIDVLFLVEKIAKQRDRQLIYNDCSCAESEELARA